jgi:1,2-diacylglycerol 3-beta-galactosyltransferase
MTIDPAPEKPHILIIFSDTGGGHRSAAEAIIEALNLDFGDRFSTQMVDIFKEYAPPPLNRMPAIYPSLVKVPQAWGLGYKLSNGDARARLITSTFWPYVRKSVRQLVKQHPSDVIVSVHPLANGPVLRALGANRPPFITVVTDLVTTHALWYHRRVDLCLVPTEEAGQRAFQCGLKHHQVKVVGLPVAHRFSQPPGDKFELREKHGWPQDLPVILLIGGGDGMGPLKRTALAIANSGLKTSLVVIAGRNKSLQEDLQAQQWPLPTFIYGFVRDMPDFMRAADILVTKAGPGTISEALNAELPMVLYSRLPGQEDGNVEFVVSKGLGVWAPAPNLIVTALKKWINEPDKRQLAAEACRKLKRPEAAQDIARIIAGQIGADGGINETSAVQATLDESGVI